MGSQPAGGGLRTGVLYFSYQRPWKERHSARLHLAKVSFAEKQRQAAWKERHSARLHLAGHVKARVLLGTHNRHLLQRCRSRLQTDYRGYLELIVVRVSLTHCPPMPRNSLLLGLQCGE